MLGCTPSGKQYKTSFIWIKQYNIQIITFIFGSQVFGTLDVVPKNRETTKMYPTIIIDYY